MPYCITGFQYVITRTGTSVAAVIARIAVKRSAIRKPAANALVVASWMIAPSITGSL